MRKLKSAHPHQTLYYRIQKGFREFKPGVEYMSFVEAWRVLYPILSEIKSDCPWGIDLYIGPTDRYSHGSMAIRFTIRFKVADTFKDCIVLLSSDSEEIEQMHINTSMYKTFSDWRATVVSNNYLKAIAHTGRWYKASSYSKL